MFSKIVVFFALVVVAFASPKPAPQVGYPDAVPAVGYTGYPGYSAYSPYAYSAPLAAAAAYPCDYSGHYLRR